MSFRCSVYGLWHNINTNCLIAENPSHPKNSEHGEAARFKIYGIIHPNQNIC